VIVTCRSPVTLSAGTGTFWMRDSALQGEGTSLGKLVDPFILNDGCRATAYQGTTIGPSPLKSPASS